MFLTSTLKYASYLFNIKCFFRCVKSNPEAYTTVSENDPWPPFISLTCNEIWQLCEFCSLKHLSTEKEHIHNWWWIHQSLYEHVNETDRCLYSKQIYIWLILPAVSLLDQTDKIQVQQDNTEEAVYVEDQQAPYITWQSCLPYEKSSTCKPHSSCCRHHHWWPENIWSPKTNCE